MLKITLTKGLPASGKSTWAIAQANNPENNTKAITKDELRLIFPDSKKREGLVLKARNSMTEQYLQEGFNVIWHDTNLNPIHEVKAKVIASQYNAIVEIKSFLDVSLNECIKRDLIRPNSVGQKVIIDMYNQYLAPKPVKYIEDINLPHIIICDIDGTVALKGDRGWYEWDKVDRDTPNQSICTMVTSLSRDYHDIVFFSGRDEICREKTLLT